MKNSLNRERRKPHTMSLNSDLMYMIKVIASNKSFHATIFPNQLVEEALIQYIKQNYEYLPEDDRIVEL